MKDMAKTRMNSKYVTILLSSVVLNLIMLGHLYVGGEWKLSWSRRAAAEAEAAASLTCSGHGRAYLDGLTVEGKPACECNTCFQGPDCSEFSDSCVAHADSGNPLFLEPFWRKHAACSAVMVAGWHRMSYEFPDHSFISQELENHIRKLHAAVGNALTAGRFIVFGAGSTLLLNAAVYALSSDNSSSAAKVVASVPFYPLYKRQTELLKSREFEFEGDTSLWRNNSDRSLNFIEFVTSPNNPDGQLKKAVLRGPSVKTIHDRAYYWPHYTAIAAPADDDLMIFTISKLTGHAGSRFGWALIKDGAVYERMSMFVALNSMGVSRDTQLRALKVLKVVLEGDGREIFNFASEIMRKRWEHLSKVLSRSKRFSLQKIDPPQYCTFFQKVRGPSPAYAWVKCEKENDKDCYEVLRAASIIGLGGSFFGVERRYVRLSLIKSQDDFDSLLHKITILVSEEEGVKTM